MQTVEGSVSITACAAALRGNLVRTGSATVAELPQQFSGNFLGGWPAARLCLGHRSSFCLDLFQ